MPDRVCFREPRREMQNSFGVMTLLSNMSAWSYPGFTFGHAVNRHFRFDLRHLCVTELSGAEAYG